LFKFSFITGTKDTDVSRLGQLSQPFHLLWKHNVTLRSSAL